MAKKEIIIDEREQQILLQIDSRVEEHNDIVQEIESLKALRDAKIQAIKEQFELRIAPKQERDRMLEGEIRNLFNQVKTKETKTQRKLTVLSGDVMVKKAVAKIDYDKKSLLEMAENKVAEYHNKYDKLTQEIVELNYKITEWQAKEPTEETQEEIEKLCVERAEIEDQQDELECDWLEYIKVKEVREFNWELFKEHLQIVEPTHEEGEEKSLLADDYKLINTDTGELIEIEGLNVVIEPEKLIIK